MYSFKNDYSDGGHPEVLKILCDTAAIQADGYGEDPYCREAGELIKTLIGKSNADVHFIAGGTLTNLIAISAFLRPYEAIISSDEGHINVYETGAIEATGHKVITRPNIDGKITVAQIEEVVHKHHFEHMVKPRLVYISQSTELGTLYSLSELQKIRNCCDQNNLLLFMDGARLGSALCSEKNDAALSNIAEICDAFYIGGTKNGTLFGEALVITNDQLKADFRYHLKQKGGLLAKGRLLGLQFIALLKNGLYFKLATHANKMAAKMQTGIRNLGYKVKFESSTNQIFPILPKNIISQLEKKYGFYTWEDFSNDCDNDSSNDMAVIRLICSWQTQEDKIDNFIQDLKALNAIEGE